MSKYIHPQDFEGTFWTVYDADFYVSTIGNDFSGDGSPKKPFLTIHKAFELSTNGEKIIVGPDEYLRVDSVTTNKNVGAELPCRLASTENIDLSTGGLLSIDGVLANANDRLLVWNQTNSAENGIYVASANAWERADDFVNPENIVPGKLVPVLEGTQNNQTVFQYVTTVDEVVVGTTSLLFTQAAVSDWGQIQGDLLNQSDLTAKISDDITVAIDNLKEGVPVDGDTLNKLYDLIQNIVGVSASATNIGDRDAQKSGLEDQQNIYVADASSDATVEAGWAIYKYLQPSDSFVKIAEQENLDVVLFTNGNGTTINGNKVDLGGDITSDTIFNDTRGAGLQKGLEYAGDYSSGYVERSLVDKAYIDLAIATAGNVSKVNTPANNQLAVWTGDSSIEGDGNLTWDGTSLSATQFNGVPLTNAGAATEFLNAEGNYVTLGAGGLTNGNGTVLNGNSIGLGGTFSNNISINSSNSSKYEVDISDNAENQTFLHMDYNEVSLKFNNSEYNLLSGLDLNLYSASMYLDNPGIAKGQLSVTSTGLTLNLYQASPEKFYGINATIANGISFGLNSNDGTLSNITIHDSNMTVKDENNSKGLVYQNDYSANGVSDNRWIPDYGTLKAYVDTAIAAAIAALP